MIDVMYLDLDAPSRHPWMFALGPKLAGSTGDNPCDIFRKRHDTSQHVTCHMSQQPEIYSPTTSFTLSTEGCEWCDGWCDRHGSSMVKKCQVIQYIKQITSNYYIQWLSMTHSWSTDINSISIVLMLPGRSGHKGHRLSEKRERLLGF